MYIKATRIDKGTYIVGYPEEYNPDDAVLFIGNYVGQTILPNGYTVSQRDGNTLTYIFEETIINNLLNGGLNSVWAVVPTPYLIQTIARAGRPNRNS